MCVKRKALRDEKMFMENKRREEAKESKETLLKEIKKLGRAIHGEKIKKSDNGLVHRRFYVLFCHFPEENDLRKEKPVGVKTTRFSELI